MVGLSDRERATRSAAAAGRSRNSVGRTGAPGISLPAAARRRPSADQLGRPTRLGRLLVGDLGPALSRPRVRPAVGVVLRAGRSLGHTARAAVWLAWPCAG